jgi:Flp pilus assembly protein TadG
MVLTGFNILLRRFLRSREGNIAIISTLMIPAIIGFCGLGAETAYWYYRQRDLQGAADIAAYDGTLVLRGGGSSTAVTTTATADAATNGWRSPSGTITVNTPPTSGSHQNSRSVMVTLTENETRYFSQIFGNTAPVVITVKATATYDSAGPACFLGLDKSKSGTVQFWCNSTAAFTACNVVSNSLASDSLKVGGAANVSVPCANSAGGADVTTGLVLTDCTVVGIDKPPAADPYASLPAPTWSSCSNAPANASSLGTDGAVTCYNGSSLSNIHTNVTLHGTIVVNGGQFSTNATGNITGTGVTLYLTNGATVTLNGSSTVNLSAPTSGTYAGIVMFGDRTQSFQTNIINGNNSSQMTGAVYFPSQEVDFLGNFTGLNGCMQLVADVIYYTGNGTFATNCTGTGVKEIPTPGSLALVE